MPIAEATAFRELVRVDGQDKIAYNFHPGQERARRSHARFVAMLAGTQSGKTCFDPVWLAEQIKAFGGGDYLVVTANYDLFKLKLLPEFLSTFEGGIVDGRPYQVNIGRYWAGERIIELAEDLLPGKFWATKQDSPMWGRIILRSAEAEAGLESATAKAAVCDEADHPDFKRTAWEAIQRRLSLSQGRCLFSTSLYHWGWLKTDIYDRWMAGAPDIEVIQFDSIENPNFSREEYERAQLVLPRWKFNLFYRGRYEKPAGLIYDSFDEATCKIARFPIPQTWPVYVGHDFGTANPAAMFYAQDPATGYFYAFHEYLPGSKSTAEHVAEFKRITEGRNVIKRAGGSHQEQGWRNDFTAHGWPIQEPKEHMRRVDLQIQQVYALHKLNKVFIFDDLHRYLEEKSSFSYKLDDYYNPTDQIENEAHFHLMASERYILSDFTPETVATPDEVPIRYDM